MLPALLESVLKISARCVLQWIGPYFHVAKSKIGNSHLKASTLASFPLSVACSMIFCLRVGRAWE